MQRRDFVKLGLLFGASSLAHSSDATATSDTTKAENVNNHSPILEADVTALQAQMNAGTLSARALTEFYLNRISHIDKSGAAINAVIELNPDALAIADALDSERNIKGDANHGRIASFSRRKSAQRRICCATLTRCWRDYFRQNKLERMGKYSFDAFHFGLERTRWINQKSVCVRPQLQRVEFGFSRCRSR